MRKIIKYLGIILIFILLLSCFGIENNDDFIKGLYVIKGNDKNLYYSNFDKISFVEIDSCNGLIALCYNQTNKILLGASHDKLYFIDTQNNKKINQIDISSSGGDDINMFPSIVRIIPHPSDSNYCILFNSSIYLVNVKNKIIEEVLWDANNYGIENYMHGISVNPEGDKVFILLSMVGYWSYNGFNKYEIRTRLIEFDFVDMQMSTVFDYSAADGPAIYISSCSSKVFFYDPNDSLMIRINTQETGQNDSIKFEKKILTNSLSDYDYAIIQDIDNGSFYKLYPNQTEHELHMEFNYKRVFGNPGVFYTTFQKFKGGDLFACVPHTSAGHGIIVDLTNKNTIKKIFDNSLSGITLLEVDNEK